MVVVAIDVGQAARLLVQLQRQLGPAQGLEDLFERTEPAGQGDASLRQLLHQLLALVHRVDFEELAESLVGELLIRQLPGNHADDEAAALEHSVGQHPHQSGARAAVHQPDAFGRHSRPRASASSM